MESSVAGHRNKRRWTGMTSVWSTRWPRWLLLKCFLFLPTALAVKVEQLVASVCPFFRLFPLYILNRLASELEFLCTSIMIIARLGLKVSLKGQRGPRNAEKARHENAENTEYGTPRRYKDVTVHVVCSLVLR